MFNECNEIARGANPSRVRTHIGMYRSMFQPTRSTNLTQPGEQHCIKVMLCKHEAKIR